MATSTWTDFIWAMLQTAIFVGLAAGIWIAMKAMDKATANTKETLQSRGVSMDDGVVSVKTDRRLEREDYIDATRRRMVNMMDTVKATGAASFERRDEPRDPTKRTRKHSK
ncbi:hypothetical protein FRC03_008879 [Tulasnella sp. 419]|nr:hypothetical protein FRC02_010524 [Tulasnella sp. 418]KAG8968014.1 hypothetical protein FRC03_008879 [Tulasnella sp. 419]